MKKSEGLEVGSIHFSQNCFRQHWQVRSKHDCQRQSSPVYTESLEALSCCILIYPGGTHSYKLAQTDGATGGLKAGSRGF